MNRQQAKSPTAKIHFHSDRYLYWRVLGDKTTISEEKLQDGLVSTGKFSQSDAAMIIESMKREEFGIEQVDGWGTIRRKVKS